MPAKPLSAQRLARRKVLADALRSGEYKRTCCTLEDRMTGSYCCLGVACRVAARSRVQISTFGGTKSRLMGKMLSDSDGAYQPNVARYYGFTQAEQRALALCNDARRLNGGQLSPREYVHTWDEIAAHIETGDLR